MAEEKDQKKDEKVEEQKEDKPEVVKEEEQAQKESEAQHSEDVSADTAGTADEEQKEAEEAEEGAEAKEETPAEVAAVSTDTETAKEASGEVKPEEKVEEKKAEKPAPTGKFKVLIKEIENLSVADLAELVKALEERFGVSAAAMPVAGGGAAAGAQGAPEAEEKSNYTVVLTEAGAQKIAVIKAVREINQQLGLKEAKDLVEAAPKEVIKDIPTKDAQEAKKKLEAAGAKAELK